MYTQINTMLISTFFVGWTIERIYFYFIFNKTKKLPKNLYTPINNTTSNTPTNTNSNNSNNSNISNSTNISTFTNTSHNSLL